MYRIKDRLAREEGFTLIELLVVVAIIGILLAIAVPSYLGFKDSANQKAAQADLRSAIPSAEQYYADNGASYAGMTPTALHSLDSGLDSTDMHITVASGDQTYCMDKKVANKYAWVTRGTAATNNGAVTVTDSTHLCA